MVIVFPLVINARIKFIWLSMSLVGNERIRLTLRMFFYNYFTDLFLTSSPTAIDEILRDVTCYFSSSYVVTLSKSFSKENGKAMIDEMTPDKVLRSDGMTVGIFQKNWDVVGRDVLLAAMDVLTKGASLKVVVKISIVLIPKKKAAASTKDFRPLLFAMSCIR